MKYCIDYRNGGMGNTILAHALFACNQVDLDLNNFFSSTGNSHAIGKINKSNLIAHHLVEYPDSSLTCVAQVICQDWWEILRLKMSYAKWHETVPMLTNIDKFFSYSTDVKKEQDQLWHQFYNVYKDSSWPMCNSIDDIVNLPIEIQQEINQVFVKADISIPQTEKQLVEWLAIVYYDMFCNLDKTAPHSEVILLGDYIQGNLTRLIDICESVMNWSWDHERSQQFYNKMLSVNQEYFDWLDQIKTATVSHVVNNLELWEQALVISKWCVDHNQPPRNLNWGSIDCNTDANNLYLNTLLRKHYGKTI